jgi:hypothetical protein
MLPGKDALGRLNERLQLSFGVTVTPTAIIDSMTNEEVPDEMVKLLASLNRFADARPGAPKG